ncbi:hypothetical protein M9H77_25239 [Catharanthus roseus]|uniref:Uncharacterized protein n=1 Tax=Catharanthus roseus TaxID=4058 RepID=A0ACC0AAC0_CATRO|nr:hypothetical protein M9H77_25239 [Catharanthus roseus]
MDTGRRFKLSRIPSPDRAYKRKRSSDENLDRFIPNRAAMDFDFAHYMVTGGKITKEHSCSASPFKEAYRKHLAEAFNMSRTRILAFRNKPPFSAESYRAPFSPIHQVESKKRGRYIPQSPEKTLDAPDMIDDFYLNLLDWSCSNVVAIALGNYVYLWDASDGSTSELIEISNDDGPVTSVRWAPDGRHLAVGLHNSHVQLWDSLAGKMLRTLREGRGSRVGSLDWNGHILTTGGLDGMIINNDVRVRSHKVGTYRGHNLEVCGLKWSASGQQLASGGNDNLVYLWSISMASCTSSNNQWIHRLEDHRSAVKALAWCPFQSNLLASGGGIGDHCIKFWNAHTAACLNSVNTGSQVCSLIWNKHEREVLSMHGFNDNQLTLWKYPSMVKISELYGHTSRVLCSAQSPDGYTVASAGADETLRIWNVFGDPKLAAKKPAFEKKQDPFPNVARIRYIFELEKGAALSG